MSIENQDFLLLLFMIIDTYCSNNLKWRKATAAIPNNAPIKLHIYSCHGKRFGRSSCSPQNFFAYIFIHFEHLFQIVDALLLFPSTFSIFERVSGGTSIRSGGSLWLISMLEIGKTEEFSDFIFLNYGHDID